MAWVGWVVVSSYLYRDGGGKTRVGVSSSIEGVDRLVMLLNSYLTWVGGQEAGGWVIEMVFFGGYREMIVRHVSPGRCAVVWHMMLLLDK